jgi:hypothetical protein
MSGVSVMTNFHENTFFDKIGNHYQNSLNRHKASFEHVTAICDYGDNSLLFI